MLVYVFNDFWYVFEDYLPYSNLWSMALSGAYTPYAIRIILL